MNTIYLSDASLTPRGWFTRLIARWTRWDIAITIDGHTGMTVVRKG